MMWDILISATRQKAKNVEERRVRKMIEAGKLGPDDCIRQSGTKAWLRVGDVDDSLWTAAKPAPDPNAATVPYVSLPAADKKEADFLLRPEPKPDAASSQWKHVTPPPARKTLRRADFDDTPAFQRRPPWEPEELDLTALVDVTLFLMFFFMVTSSYSMQKSLELPKPPVQEQTAQQAPSMEDLRDDNIILEVLADDSILLNDRDVPVEELPELLRNEMKQTGLNEIILKASPEAHHEAVVKAFDAANDVGAQRIRLASASDTEPPG